MISFCQYASWGNICYAVKTYQSMKTWLNIEKCDQLTASFLPRVGGPFHMSMHFASACAASSTALQWRLVRGRRQWASFPCKRRGSSAEWTRCQSFHRWWHVQHECLAAQARVPYSERVHAARALHPQMPRSPAFHGCWRLHRWRLLCRCHERSSALHTPFRQGSQQSMPSPTPKEKKWRHSNWSDHDATETKLD